MLDLVAWGESLRKLLGDFVMAATSFIGQIPGMSKSDAEKKLEEYGKELSSSSKEFSNAKLAYKNAVEAYLKKFPPSFSNDLANNLREYDKLIVFSLRSGNKAMLLEWGIQKLPKNLNWTNDPLEKSKYVQGLQDLCDKAPGAEEYYEYLIQCFK